MSLKVAFAGTPEFAARALEALVNARFSVPLVLTQPDRPAGRGMKLQASAVKQLAQAAGLSVVQPRGLRLDGRWSEDARTAHAALVEAQPDVMVVAAYGLILPPWVLEGPRLGCLNIHASLLPRWRGAAPIHRAVEAGDDHSGITIMQMDAGLDTGPMLMTESVRLRPQETTATLHDRLAGLGARLIVEALELAACGGLRPQPQPLEGATYAHKIEKSEAPLDWLLPATVLERRVRAFNPFPGATLQDGETLIKVWEARAVEASGGAPGVLLPHAEGPLAAEGVNRTIRVACGQGALELTVLQRPSGNRQPADVVARALNWEPGHRLT